jgi:hypothetical protein
VGHEWVLWVLVTASALHVVEEHALGWQGWATATFARALGAVPTWTTFWATNALLIVFNISAAVVGWRAPAFALGAAAEALINAVFFHLLPTIRARRPNPGVFTACTLYIPIGIWAYLAAGADGVLSPGTVILSALIGAAALASAFLMIYLGGRFGYADLAEIPPAAPAAGD